tara:strand:- start:235 stop:399 length:165 start_codon:yes stop_codon:yes gene_type:complete
MSVFLLLVACGWPPSAEQVRDCSAFCVSQGWEYHKLKLDSLNDFAVCTCVVEEP